MRSSLIAGVLALALSSTAAFASDFTGPRVEALLGTNNVSSQGIGFNGLTYGVRAGYDFAVTPTVTLGLEGAAVFTNAKLTAGNTSLDVNRDLEIGARLGVKVSDTVLLFGRGAYANTGLTTVTFTPTGSVKSSGTEGAFRLGAGAEFAITKNLFTTVNYAHTFNSGSNQDGVAVGLGVRF